VRPQPTSAPVNASNANRIANRVQSFKFEAIQRPNSEGRNICIVKRFPSKAARDFEQIAQIIAQGHALLGDTKAPWKQARRHFDMAYEILPPSTRWRSPKLRFGRQLCVS